MAYYKQLRIAFFKERFLSRSNDIQIANLVDKYLSKAQVNINGEDTNRIIAYLTSAADLSLVKSSKKKGLFLFLEICARFDQLLLRKKELAFVADKISAPTFAGKILTSPNSLFNLLSANEHLDPHSSCNELPDEYKKATSKHKKDIKLVHETIKLLKELKKLEDDMKLQPEISLFEFIGKNFTIQEEALLKGNPSDSENVSRPPSYS